jgi:wyosine [tRNA(Phe)-imidazoG37] synthetase (radical SAM superfamily)
MSKYRYLYGPVPSRRLGRSLGVDLVPHKICTYDCIYCQIGNTTKGTLTRDEYSPTEEVLKEVEHFLSEADGAIDHVSLSGSGEPTLHSGIRPIINRIKDVSSVPVAVITNGSLLFEEEVRRDLLRADVVLPSLDAVSPEVFERINRPYGGLSAEKVVEGMVEFRSMYSGRIWLEILFCRGVNDTPAELEAMKRATKRIRPDLIHLNTVVRPPSEKWAVPLSRDELERIKAFFGESASIITEFDRHLPSAHERNVRDRILRTLNRRPLSMTDLASGMGIPRDEMERALRDLVEEGAIIVRVFEATTFYEVARTAEDNK